MAEAGFEHVVSKLLEQESGAVMKKLIGLTFIVVGLGVAATAFMGEVSVLQALGGVGCTVLGLVATWEAERGKK